jgi:hypothetical protein
MSIHKPSPAQSYMGLFNRPGNGSSCRPNLETAYYLGLLHTHLNLETIIPCLVCTCPSSCWEPDCLGEPELGPSAVFVADFNMPFVRVILAKRAPVNRTNSERYWRWIIATVSQARMNLSTGTCESKSKCAAKISLQSLMRSLGINFCVVNIAILRPPLLSITLFVRRTNQEKKRNNLINAFYFTVIAAL